jgi:hypothetical protein
VFSWRCWPCRWDISAWRHRAWRSGHDILIEHPQRVIDTIREVVPSR